MDEHEQHHGHDHSEHGQQQEDHSQHDAGDHAANNAVVERKPESYVIQGDPTEAALLVAAQKASLNTSEIQQRFRRVGEMPFSSDRKMMSTVQTHPERGEVLAIAVKGAPDVLLGRCHFEFVNRAQKREPRWPMR